jgi:hypothetical protein
MLDKTELDTAGQQLLQIADYIEEHDWCQGAYRSSGGQVCILGAARELFSDHDQTQGMLKLFEHLGNMNVDEWNDEEGRTKEQVIDKLREVAFLP